MFAFLLSTSFALTLEPGAGAEGYASAAELATELFGSAPDYAWWASFEDGGETFEGLVVGTTESGVERTRMLVFGYCEGSSFGCVGTVPVLVGITRTGNNTSGASWYPHYASYYASASGAAVHDLDVDGVLTGSLATGSGTLSISNGFGQVTTSWSGPSSWLTPRQALDKKSLEAEIARAVAHFRWWLDNVAVWGDHDGDTVINIQDPDWVHAPVVNPVPPS